MANCLNFGIISKVSVGSVTGGFIEGDILTVKKVVRPDAKAIPYISGECIRYAFRQKFREKGEKISPLEAVKVAGRTMGMTAMNIKEYIDDDLFGFMSARPGEIKRRISPVKVSAWVGLFPHTGPRDLGTRETGAVEKAMFETEVYHNYFAGNIMIDLERVGILVDELTGKVVETLDRKERERRIKLFVSILPELWGGGKQTRFLCDLSPKFLIYAKQKSKVPIFLEAIKMHEDESIVVDPLIEVIEDYKDIIENRVVGLRKGIFSNENEIREKFKKAGMELQSIQQAVDTILKETFYR